MPNDFNFHKEEYLALRRQIEMTLQQFSQLRRYSLIGAAVAFAWIANQDFTPETVNWLAWSIPTVIPICGLILMLSKSAGLNKMGGYIAEIENVYLKDMSEARGWENYRAKYREILRKESKIKSLTTYTADLIFWIIFIILSLVITVIGGIYAA